MNNNTTYEFHQEPDGSVMHKDGRVIYFSCERFISDICEGDCCFICGTTRGCADFNDEHILPDWLLRKFRLHSQTITLSNGQRFNYGRYKIPCCVTCNTRMGGCLEIPVSAILSGTGDDVCDAVVSGRGVLLSCWMALIYLKVHLKDRSFLRNQDRRVSSTSISSDYEWETLHHLHCLVRSFYTDAYLDAGVTGSFFILPFRDNTSQELFDFADLYPDQCMMMRVGDIVMYSVFDDGCGSLSAMTDLIGRIEGPLNKLQAREMLAHLACVRRHLVEPPIFRSDVTREDGYRIRMAHPDHVIIHNVEKAAFGDALWHLLSGIVGPNFEIRGVKGEAAANLVKAGSITFLFDDDGKFQNFCG